MNSLLKVQILIQLSSVGEVMLPSDAAAGLLTTRNNKITDYSEELCLYSMSLEGVIWLSFKEHFAYIEVEEEKC